MKKINIIIRALLFIAMPFSILTGCATIEGDWENAQQKDSAQSYNVFLAKHPKSKFSKTAKEILNWKQARQENTADSYYEFLDKYPESKHLEQAKKLGETLEWKEARQKNSIKAYLAFLNRYPNSQHKKTAATKVNEMRVAKYDLLKKRFTESINNIEIIPTRTPQTFKIEEFSFSRLAPKPKFTLKKPLPEHRFVIVALSLQSDYKLRLNNLSNDITINACGTRYRQSPYNFTRSPPDLQPGDLGPWRSDLSKKPDTVIAVNSSITLNPTKKNIHLKFIFQIPEKCIKKSKLSMYGKKYSVAKYLK